MSVIKRHCIVADVPRSFEETCRAAKLGIGSLLCGYRLTLWAQQQIPEGCSPNEWRAEITDLDELIAHRRDQAIIEWFRQHYPACMQLVPSRRLNRFLDGVYQWAAEQQSLATSTADSALDDGNRDRL